MEMLSLYHDVDGKLMMTHYCNAAQSAENEAVASVPCGPPVILTHR